MIKPIICFFQESQTQLLEQNLVWLDASGAWSSVIAQSYEKLGEGISDVLYFLFEIVFLYEFSNMKVIIIIIIIVQ